MKLALIKPSSREGKKYEAIFEDDEHKKTVHFGAKGYTDFIHLKAEKDPEAEAHKERYRERHRKDLLGDPITPGYLSYYVLWNKPTFRASLADYGKRFNL